MAPAWRIAIVGVYSINVCPSIATGAWLPSERVADGARADASRDEVPQWRAGHTAISFFRQIQRFDRVADEVCLRRTRIKLRTVRGLSASTVAQHLATIQAFLHEALPDGSPLSALTREFIERHLVTTGRRISRQSLQHWVARLRSFLRFCRSDAQDPGAALSGNASRVRPGGGPLPPGRRLGAVRGVRAIPERWCTTSPPATTE